MYIFNRKLSIFRKKIKSYLLGSIYSSVLTFLPFLLVMQHIFSDKILLFTIILCFILNFFVHCRYFLHLDTSIENRWYLTVVLFTCTIIFIIISGSLWIMSNLHNY